MGTGRQTPLKVRGVRGVMKYLYNNTKGKSIRRNLRNNSTDAERFLWRYLRARRIEGKRFLRQYSVGSYILDFYSPTIRLAIELDGGQHAEEDIEKYDRERARFLQSKNIIVLRFWNNEVFQNIEGVLQHVKGVILSIKN